MRQGKKKPNILHIFTDQQRFDTIGAINNPIIKTPNLDRLCKDGVIFTNAYTPCPVCVAARCSMIYGQYPMNTGCYENTIMPTDGRQSFMEVLTQEGYRTHGIGKCHFSPDSFALRGFQSRERQEEGGSRDIEKDPYFKAIYDAGYKHIMEAFGIRGEMYYIPQPSQLPSELHPTQWVGDRSINFIREQSTNDQAWYLFSSFIHPHPPFTPPNPWHKLYRSAMMPLPKVPDDVEALQTYVNKCQNRYKYRDHGIDKNLLRCMKAYYYACISFIDFQIGRILEVLEATDQIDNTLILFTSDHGEHLGDYNCFGKRSMHDSCARIPFIVSMKGRFDGGKVCDTPVSLVDVAPTFLGAIEANFSSHEPDGVDVADILSGSSDRKIVFAQHSYARANPVGGNEISQEYLDDPDLLRSAMSQYMAVSKEWKYFYSAPDNMEFLFDKIHDPNETRNKAGIVFTQGILADMRSKLFEHLSKGGEVKGIDGNRWRKFCKPDFPSDPDAGLLIQDGYTPWTDTFLQGYSDK
jgi:arylsulfatase A-like enzyme